MPHLSRITIMDIHTISCWNNFLGVLKLARILNVSSTQVGLMSHPHKWVRCVIDISSPQLLVQKQGYLKLF
jgi:hypothetical protein